jgi:hypothetical protein
VGGGGAGNGEDRTDQEVLGKAAQSGGERTAHRLGTNAAARARIKGCFRECEIGWGRASAAARGFDQQMGAGGGGDGGAGRAPVEEVLVPVPGDDVDDLSQLAQHLPDGRMLVNDRCVCTSREALLTDDPCI